MTIQLDHSIVPSRHKAASVPSSSPSCSASRGRRRRASDRSPRCSSTTGSRWTSSTPTRTSPVYHFCFRVSDAEFDAILGRIQAAGIDHRSTLSGPVDRQVDTRFGGRGIYWSVPRRPPVGDVEVG